LKRKHELSRRKAEAQLQMLKVKQQMEAEQVIEMEKSKVTQELVQNKVTSLKELDEKKQQEKSATEKAE
jgi:hypothetical protein